MNQSQWVISELYNAGAPDPKETPPNFSKKQEDFFRLFITYVGRWVGQHSASSLEWLGRNKKLIPRELRKGGTIYRGFSFKDQEPIKKIIMGSGFELRETGAWSRNRKSAELFANGPGAKKFGVLLVKKVSDSDVVLDVVKFVKSKKMKRIARFVKGWVFTKDDYDFAESEGEILIKFSNPLITKFDVDTLYKDQRISYDLV